MLNAPTASESTTSPSPNAPGTGADRPPVGLPRWARWVPFFLSALLFLSGIFALFSPLPLILLRFRSGRAWAWLAILVNCIIVSIAGGTVSLEFFLVFIVPVAFLIPELLERRRSIERAGAVTLLGMLLVAGGVGLMHAKLQHVNPIEEIRQQISTTVDHLDQSLTESNDSSAPSDPQEVKSRILLELPSAAAIFALIVVWANLTFLLRMNPGHIRQRLGIDPGFFRNWKAPEFLVWPTIATGFFLLFDWGTASDVALNAFKFLMAVYALQGLSILSFLFDVWNVRGFFRTLGFVAVVFLMMPLLLGLGFFDLWFDFRGKLRQS